MVASSDTTRSSASSAPPIAEELLYGTHGVRARMILRAVPEIGDYMGKNRWTFLLIAALVSGQIGLAFLSPHLPWWLGLATAYFVGATICHALFVLIHDCCHNLVFRRPSLNRVAEFVANFPLVFPCATSFSRAHRQHHIHLGDHVNDPDVAFDWEAKLIGRSAWRKCVWLTIYPLCLVPRSFRNAALVGVDRWVVLNVLTQLSCDAIIWAFGGVFPLVYLAISAWFSVSLHPFGARWIQEHYMVVPPQRTYSYYGPANWVACNIGYHNEHHDFPNIPWNRLPRIRRLGGAWYDGLAHHRSWTRLLGQFIFDRRFHLHRRMAPVQRPAEGELV